MMAAFTLHDTLELEVGHGDDMEISGVGAVGCQTELLSVNKRDLVAQKLQANKLTGHGCC